MLGVLLAGIFVGAAAGIWVYWVVDTEIKWRRYLKCKESEERHWDPSTWHYPGNWTT